MTRVRRARRRLGLLLALAAGVSPTAAAPPRATATPRATAAPPRTAAAPPRTATAPPRTAAAPPRTAAAPPRTGKPRTPPQKLGPARDPNKLGAHARVAFARAGELRPAREPVAAGRRADPPTPEEDAAAQIQKLLRGPLRAGVTGLFVADAKTGEPLFAVNADDPLNPASNVKMISTATAIELLGPDFRYPTRLLGPPPDGGVVHGDVYLLGSHDPTLATADLDDLTAALATRGITAIEGDIVVGADPTRDGLYRAIVPIAIAAGEPGKPPIAAPPAGFDLVTVKVTATTARGPMRPRLTYKEEATTDAQGRPRIALTIGGAIGKGGATTYPLSTRQRTAAAAYALIASLRARQIAVSGELKLMELGEFVGASVTRGGLPVELGRHESLPVSDIVARINKWSINWLADRLIMTAAALVARKPPSMELGLEAMYAWLSRHPHLGKPGVVLDTGSGLSYNTQISPQALVSVVRSAAGFVAGDTTRSAADAWLGSLSVAGTDGTLAHRFLGTTAAGRIHGKTGTLSTVIALSGVLDIDPQRPLAFALVTNSDAPLPHPYIRRAHELVIGELCKYLSKTAAHPLTAPPPPAPPKPVKGEDAPDEAGYDPQLDADTLEKK
ncbi:MAG TPA: D-alanyl-D-alanine carboxypeptidase/D-alanyl-D-alanine-endopeptidase [Kofleriaceae bacterium]|nr:D-alanyl-D-alanine carboxypeptidase/D-alanyl-D-alanine-endopeptidase [Kofleriaceae bacterium]